MKGFPASQYPSTYQPLHVHYLSPLKRPGFLNYDVASIFRRTSKTEFLGALPVKGLPITQVVMEDGAERYGKRMGVDLPYGQTRVTAAEYEDLVDVDDILTHLDRGTATDPTPQVEGFVRAIPHLLEWLEQSGRDYPWRYTTDPWRVYATEILLQRTRADAVADIYEDFFDAFPSPEEVVKADEREVYDRVYSLGFGNQRTRSIREAAALCVNQYGGKVPADLDALQEPWRVGPYSARACLMFAFNKPLALVDSNIARIIERVFSYEMPQQPHKKDSVYALAETLIPSDPALARAINFAFLDLGALICTESDPSCENCPLNSCCIFGRNALSH